MFTGVTERDFSLATKISPLLSDRQIEILEKPNIARWYCQIGNDSPPSRDKCRLTTWIDRADNTKTKTKIFGFEPTNYILEPPETKNIWISLP